ncbi:hypothetical protein MNEG_5449 [Monoraphidium neglectum]|uniref:Wax synthase domain-containing protein n=1 Tax=Monoraphidium neglectum TaxID=145388 RepID=A0A0D2NAA3_9CHLO|nr:hypothetical protein MNEG_5449 [Monoraphidium neglectum]KIZ02506.1 hypothetical protein MNEG_5449 [Monoraphidium neglectum]|eukprot:XP_013901525.1 hypothetical protein MNEG_5449 [Monoraphidium neglectum]
MGRGPLQHARLPNFQLFAAAMCLPVIPLDVFKLSGGRRAAAATAAPATTARAFLFSYCLKVAAAVSTVALTYAPQLPRLAVYWLYALTLSMSVGGIWDAYCALAIAVAHSFDAPWLSTSFADYWSRRWNLTISYMLRVLVYEPVLEGRLVPKTAASDADALGNLQPAPPRAAAAGVRPARPRNGGAEAPAGCEEGALSGVPAAVGAAPAPAASGACGRGDCTPSGLSGDSTYGLLGGGSKGAASDPDAKSRGYRGAAVAAASAAGGDGDDGAVRGAELTACVGAALRHRTAAAAARHELAGGDGRGATRAPAPAKPGRAARLLLRRAAALQATFLFSGLWHMLIWRNHHVPGHGWRWLAFFSAQAPVIVAEAGLRALWLRRWRLPPPPRWASVLLTNFLLIVIADPLFFGPCDSSGMCPRMMESIKGS